MKLKLIAILLVTGTISAYAQKSKTESFPGIKIIRLTAAAGSAKFVKSSGNNVKVTLEYTYDDSEFEYKMDKRETTLVLEEEFHGHNISGRSSWSFEVPDGIEVRFTSGSGDLDIQGLDLKVKANQGSGSTYLTNTKGDFRLATGSGDHEIRNHTGDLDISTGSGEIDATGADGELEFATGSGDIDISQCKGIITASVGSGSIDAKGLDLADYGRFSSGSGDVKVTLTSELKYGLRIASGSGDATLDFGGTPINATIVMETSERNGRIIAPFNFDKEEVIERSGNNSNTIRKTVKLGNGKADIKVSSGSGRAEIRK